MTLFGNRVTADNKVEIIDVGPNPLTGVLIKVKRLDPTDIPRENTT